jgi:D-glycero-alpha-D-manno-heptose-7-phosphate kinase
LAIGVWRAIHLDRYHRAPGAGPRATFDFRLSTGLIDRHTANGSRGSLIGAGGGGFLLFYCPNSHKGQLRRVMAEEGLREMPFDFDLEGAKVLVDF